MSATRPAPLAPSAQGGTAAAGTTAAGVAKAALRRLALAQLEPTPENFARAYDEELGLPPRPVLPGRAQAQFERLAIALVPDEGPRQALLAAFCAGQSTQVERILDAQAVRDGLQGEALGTLLGRLVRGLERSNRSWTLARRKESVKSVIDGSRADAARLQQRLAHLVASWDADMPDSTAPAPLAPVPAPASEPPAETLLPAVAVETVEALASVGEGLLQSLPEDDPRAQRIAGAIGSSLARVAQEGSPVLLAELRSGVAEAVRLQRRRHALLDHTRSLCGELTAALTELAEDGSWARGQCETMQARLADDGLEHARGVRSVSALLHATRTRQQAVRLERDRAREALKSMIQQMLHEVGELGIHSGRFSDGIARYAEVIEHADSLESLAGVVREMVSESRTVQALVDATRERLQDEHARALDLSRKVKTLEDELRHLSDEVSTDPLTQIANRRGLMRAFDAARAAFSDPEAPPLALGLLDVDNFKRLNDQLGHGAGDEALKSLAARVQGQLRPSDLVARYGGEEFVVMLPATSIEEALQVLSRMQRAMTEALFLHESTPVFVTFSAGVTLYRHGERLEDALDRADEALYEAKRTGKNRTCVG